MTDPASFSSETFRVLRVSAAAALAAGGGIRAALRHPGGAADLHLDLPADPEGPADFIVIESGNGRAASTRAWVRQGGTDVEPMYDFFAATPAQFPARSFPLAALQPRGARSADPIMR
ncbi:hypothetical protein ABIQ69_02770 [Agromyces sp. G08B096]|uniref:Siderophore-interacting protein n=1 Tax=Agromyces sp. G08B096 TaxID=3156399 RepID=A0AAU7W7L3_9MICO